LKAWSLEGSMIVYISLLNALESELNKENFYLPCLSRYSPDKSKKSIYGVGVILIFFIYLRIF